MPLATQMHQKLINLQAVRAGPMWTIPQRRRAPTAGTCGVQEQSPTTRTVTATAGRIGKSPERTQEGRARPKNLPRQQKSLQLTMGGITRTGRTLLTLFCTASNGRLTLDDGGERVLHAPGVSWLTLLICYFCAFHSFSFLLSWFRKEKKKK